MTKNKIISIIAILILLAAGGYLGYKNIFQGIIWPYSVGEGEKPLMSEQTIDTSTWKTYRNEQYGFEVRYPEKVIFSSVNKPIETTPTPFTSKSFRLLLRIPLSGSGAFALELYENQTTQERIREIVSQSKQISPPEPITVAGKSGEQLVVDTGEGGIIRVVLWEDKSILYVFFHGMGENDQDKDLKIQMLSTFKFIE